MTPHEPEANPPDTRELPALAWLRREHAEDELLREIRAKVKRRRSRRIAGALLVALGLGAAVFRGGWTTGHAPRAAAETVATTATVSRPDLRELPDGSTVELKDGARIEVDFGGTFRRVALVSGEAHFKVTKDRARPFVVRARGVEVLAVGTAFAVQLASEAVDVLVTEGRVQVGAEAAKDRAVAFVDSGSRCLIAADLTPRVAAISATETGERLAWRVPQLEFSRTPLSEVVGLMNRHAPAEQPVRFEIADGGLNAIKLTGFLRADNAEGLVRLLEGNFQVRAERIGDRIVLRRGQ